MIYAGQPRIVDTTALEREYTANKPDVGRIPL